MDQIILLFSEIVKLITLENILLFLVCSAAGVVIGCLPGMSASMGIALLTGLTYGYPLQKAFIMLMSIYVGAIYGGSISAVLIGIPGTGSAACTVLDGNKMARKGQGRLALNVATVASFIGTVFGVLCLTALTPMLQSIALNFTSVEYALLAIFGITICGSMSSAGDPIKGWIAGFLGMMISCIGLDPIYGYPRFTYNVVGLLGGIAMVPAMIGLFGVPNLLHELANDAPPADIAKMKKEAKGEGGIIWTTKKHLRLILQSGVIGTFIGAIPGVGEDVAAWLSYDTAKKTSKTPEKFNTGHIEGVIAAETANNSAIGGALIPLLSLGVPGSGPAAILLGSFTLHGVICGPMLAERSPTFIIEMSAILLVAALFMRFSGMLVCQVAPKVLSIPTEILMPVIGALCIVGSYVIYANMFDVKVMFFIGLLGFVLDRLHYPAAPVVLGVILGPMCDSNIRRALVASKGSLAPFYTRPIAVICLIAIAWSFLSQTKLWKKGMAALGSRLKGIFKKQ